MLRVGRIPGGRDRGPQDGGGAPRMHARFTPTRRSRRLRAVVIGLALVIALPASSLGASGHPNPPASYVALSAEVQAAGGAVVPLSNSGQTLDGVTFEGIPDGLG